jgi:molybdopterin-guanine dinucleotide biosynthesis protein A
MVVGVILAGGVGQRMGGVVKPLLPFAEGTLFSCCHDRFRPQVRDLALSVHDGQAWGGDAAVREAFSFSGSVIYDRVAVTENDRHHRAGPLAGFLSALQWADQQGVDWVALLPGDTPFIPHDLVARLLAAARDAGLPSAHARSAGRDHPAVALLHRCLEPALRGDLAQGERRVWRWLSAQGTRAVDWPTAVSWGEATLPLDPFWNVNLPQDLEWAQSMVAQATS